MEGIGRGGFVSVVWVDYGVDGLWIVEMYWNFRSSWFYVVFVVVGRSDGNGVGSREGIKGE